MNTLAPLHDGVTQIVLDAAEELEIASVEVDGVAAKFTHDGERLSIECGGLAPRERRVP